MKTILNLIASILVVSFATSASAQGDFNNKEVVIGRINDMLKRGNLDRGPAAATAIALDIFQNGNGAQRHDKGEIKAVIASLENVISIAKANAKPFSHNEGDAAAMQTVVTFLKSAVSKDADKGISSTVSTTPSVIVVPGAPPASTAPKYKRIVIPGPPAK